MVDEKGVFIEKTQKAFSKNVLLKRTANKMLTKKFKRIKESNSMNEEKNIAFGDSIFKQPQFIVPTSCSSSRSSSASSSSRQSSILPVTEPEISEIISDKQMDKIMEVTNDNDSDSDIIADDEDKIDENNEDHKYLYFIPEGIILMISYFFFFLKGLINSIY